MTAPGLPLLRSKTRASIGTANERVDSRLRYPARRSTAQRSMGASTAVTLQLQKA